MTTQQINKLPSFEQATELAKTAFELDPSLLAKCLDVNIGNKARFISFNRDGSNTL